MVEMGFDGRVEAVRHFNRFYTKQIGALCDGLLDSPFSLTEARVLYELAHRTDPTATDLGKELGLDAGYLSRILRGFEKRGLVKKQPSDADGRQNLLRLTKRGQAAFAPLDARSREEIGAMITTVSETEQARLVAAMRVIESLLGRLPDRNRSYLLRPHRPGDMGWVIHRHGVLYAGEYGWDERFEGLVADIAAQFIKVYDPKRECCWIAEKDGESVGSVFLVEQSKTVAKLRLLLVDPKARGLGIGARLIGECVRFAQQAGYRKIMLWTQSILLAARHLYEAAGFRLVHEEPHCSFGYDLIGETWELTL